MLQGSELDLIYELASDAFGVEPVTRECLLARHAAPTEDLADRERAVGVRTAVDSLLQQGILKEANTALREIMQQSLRQSNAIVPPWTRCISETYPPDGSLVLCETKDGILSRALVQVRRCIAHGFGWSEIQSFEAADGTRHIRGYACSECFACQVVYDRLSRMCGHVRYPMVRGTSLLWRNIVIQDYWWRAPSNGACISVAITYQEPILVQ